MLSVTLARKVHKNVHKMRCHRIIKGRVPPIVLPILPETNQSNHERVEESSTRPRRTEPLYFTIYGVDFVARVKGQPSSDIAGFTKSNSVERMMLMARGKALDGLGWLLFTLPTQRNSECRPRSFL